MDRHLPPEADAPRTADSPAPGADSPHGQPKVWLGLLHTGVTRLNAALDAPSPISARLLRRAGVAAAAIALSIGVMVPAFASPSEDLKKAQDNLSQAENKLDSSSNDLEAAQNSLSDAESQLNAAEAELARIQGELSAAQDRDAESRERLAAAQRKLEMAKAAVAANQARVDKQRELAGAVVRDQYQKQNQLVGLAMIVDDTTAGTLQTRAQWSTTMFNATQAKLDALKEAQAKLEAAKEALAEAEAEAQVEREAAAANLATVESLEIAASEERARIDSLVSSRSQARAEVANQVEADQERVVAMEAESAQAQKKLDEFKAEEARKAEAERKKREEEAAKKKAEAEKAAAEKKAAEKKAAEAKTAAEREKAEKEAKEAEKKKQQAEKQQKQKSDNSRDATKTSSAAAVSPIKPGNYRISAVFGQTGLWARYHTGLDFAGVYTGTPIYAVKDGVVLTSRAGGWAGTHVILRHDNGESTLYAHMSRKSASTGKVVKKGDIIGYTGATGNVTGPHLHFEYYPKGATPGSVYSAKNPRTWLNANGVKV